MLQNNTDKMCEKQWQGVTRLRSMAVTVVNIITMTIKQIMSRMIMLAINMKTHDYNLKTMVPLARNSFFA